MIGFDPGEVVDGVTQLAVKAIAMGHLERSLALAQRDKRAVGVLSIGADVPRLGDVDPPTDELMKHLAARVKALTRASDLAARYGRAELVIVLTAMGDPNDAAIVAVRLLLELSKPYTLLGRQRSATVCIGAASFPADGAVADALVNAARQAMARARAQGGGYKVASPVASAVR
ncbi:MAG TPA: diguanylate cyclase [Candidatus Limnocylindria bacterium]|nr:diguanylate cyclase [Candidatus Limnocylindria bacterium]